MRVLVTGADGFIGTAVAEQLRARGHDVTGLVFRRPAGPDELRADLTREDAMPGVEVPVEAVVHTAGSVDTNAGSRALRAINAEGTRRVAQWAQARDVQHVIHTSSIAVYGMRTMGEGRTEATPRAHYLGIAYGRSKALAERYLERSGVPFTSLRLPSVFGAGDGVVTPAIVPRLLAGQLGPTGGRIRRFSTLWVDNLARVVGRLLELGPQQRHLNCSCGQTTWDDFIAAYTRALGLPPAARQRRRDTLAAALRSPAVLRDPEFLYVTTTGRFGAHFPADALYDRLGPLPLRPWQDGVVQAVAHWRATQ